MTVDHLTHLRTNSARFIEVLRDVAPDARVPTCPDWQADDLLWHLGEVQWFWGTIVRDELTDPDGVEAPPRPPDRVGLVAFFDDASAQLGAALAATNPSDHRWTWAEDQTVGFILRRQSHEALIHRIDAELTAGVERADIDVDLATDGVDEALQVMYGGAPPWALTELDTSSTLLIHGQDRDRAWLATLGTFSGTSPRGNTYDGDVFMEVADADPHQRAAATIAGSAVDLDCWLWGRPTAGRLDRGGDPSVLDRFAELISAGID